jgi:hypothetical protein
MVSAVDIQNVSEDFGVETLNNLILVKNGLVFRTQKAEGTVSS